MKHASRLNPQTTTSLSCRGHWQTWLNRATKRQHQQSCRRLQRIEVSSLILSVAIQGYLESRCTNSPSLVLISLRSLLGTSNLTSQTTPSPPSTTGVTLTSFDQYFTKLPIDLRLKIWHLIIQPEVPGMVEVGVKLKEDSAEWRRIMKDKPQNAYCFEFDSNPAGNFIQPRNALDFRPLSSIPVILHICQESRTEGLRYYKLSFGTGAWHEPRTYVKHSKPNEESPTLIDTVCIRFPRYRGLHTQRQFLCYSDALTKLCAGVAYCLVRHNIENLGLFAPSHIRNPAKQLMYDYCSWLSYRLSAISKIYIIVGEDKKEGGQWAGFLDAGSQVPLFWICNFLTHSQRVSPAEVSSVLERMACKIMVRESDGRQKRLKMVRMVVRGLLGRSS